MKLLFYIIPLLSMLCACQPTLLAEFEDRPVVQCYLDAGASPTLTISKLIAFRDDAIYSSEDINALSITITDQTSGDAFYLSGTGDGNYENPTLIVQAGHTYTLSFIYNSEAVYAITTVPEAPEDVEFSATSIGVMSFNMSSSAGISRANPGDGIEITWENDDENYYIVEGITTSSSPVRDVDDDEDDPSKSFKLDYTRGASATLSSMQFSYYGIYNVSVMRIQPEYAIMSQGSGSNSGDLNDVRGNIDGGYGIFTGINRVVQTVSVYRQTSPF